MNEQFQVSSSHCILTFFILFSFSYSVEQKNQLILILEQKVVALESQSNQSSGQHSPDMVVVTPSDLLGSEPILTSESFEEVSADKVWKLLEVTITKTSFPARLMFFAIFF